MAKNTRKEQNEDLLENPEKVTTEKINKAEAFIEKNRKLVTYIGGVLGALILIGWFGYGYYEDQSNEAQVEMFPAQFYFDKDSFNLALNGDGASLGFLDIVDEYGWTEAGNLAQFYAGVCYMKTGQYGEAIDHLSQFSANDWVLQARAYSLIGDANMELEQPGEAISQYKKAVNYEPNKSFTPTYMMKLGLAYETIGDWSKAANIYDELIDSYPTASQIQDAKRFKARAKTEAQRQSS